MNAQPAIRRRIGIGLVAVFAALLTSACATGQHAQTADEQPAIDATSGAVGSLQLHNVAIKTPTGPAYQAGDAAEVQLVVVNTGRQTDTLQSVSTPTASGFRVFASSTDASAALSPSETSAGSGSSSVSGTGPAASDSASGNGSAPGGSTSSRSTSSGSASGSTGSGGSTSGSKGSSSKGSSSKGSSSSGSSSSGSSSPGSSSPASGSSGSGSTAPAPAAALDIAAGQALSLGVTGPDRVLLLRLTRTLFPGTALPITFTFAKAGSVTLTVPVQISDDGSPGLTIPPLSSGTPG